MRRAGPVPVLLNRGGGACRRNPHLASDVADMLAEAGLKAKVEMMSGPDIAERCAELAKDGVKLVAVGGGDGTISAAAGALAGTDAALAVLPLGTLNHFARDLGIPADVEEAVRLLATGLTRRVDVAEVNGRVFLNNSSIGLYPLMVVDRDAQRQRLGRSKRLAMIVASARTLARFGRERLTLTINEEERARVDTPLLFVGNNEYCLDIGRAGQRNSLSDGRLDVLVMRKRTRRGMIAAVLRTLLNRSRKDDMVRLDDVRRLRVGGRRTRITVSLDGEVTSLSMPLDYRVREGALTVVVAAGT
jgi:YegS/Rv2252/BmrU family lipid kinase